MSATAAMLQRYAIKFIMPTWEEKRQKILERDNFTCQSCHQFNPELGRVEFHDGNSGQVEFHEYFNHPDPFEAEYHIEQSISGFTFQINFGNCWPVFPIMQVHHKKYIDGKDRWDYHDDDLITYCKQCHIALHLNNTIPIYTNDNHLKEERMFLPVDLGSGRRHNCENWTFIQQIGGGEYVVSNIHPTIRMVLFDHEDPVDAERQANNTLQNFIAKYFPRYSARG